MISEAKLKQLYGAMLKYRMLEERFHLAASGKVIKGTVAYRPARGEAAAAGVLLDLRRDDWFAPSPRDIPATFLKDVPLPAVLALLREVHAIAASPAKQSLAPPPTIDAGLHLVPPAPTTAVQLDLAAGVALALYAKQKGAVVVAFCETASRRSWTDALTIAAFRCLPLVVVARGGSWLKAPKTATSKTKTRPALLVSEAHACGVPIIPVDAGDVVAIYRVAHESIHKARHGGGPTLIEARKFDLPLPGVARKPGATPPEAIVRMEDYLAAKGIFDPRWKQRLVRRFTEDMDDAFQA